MKKYTNKTTNEGWGIKALEAMMRAPIMEDEEPVFRGGIYALPDIDGAPSHISDSLCDESSSIANPDRIPCKMYDSSIKEIEAAINILISVFQTSKAIYLDAPEELIWEYAEVFMNLKDISSLLREVTETDKKDKEVE